MAGGNAIDNEFSATGQQFVNAPQKITTGAASARSTVLSKGRYRIVVRTNNCFIRQGGSTIDAVALTDTFLPKDTLDYFVVTGASDAYLAAIQDGAPGILELLGSKKPLESLSHDLRGHTTQKMKE